MGRFAFILRRPFQLIPVIIGISLITFVLLQLTPGDPVRVMLGSRASPEAIQEMRTRYGLDRTVIVQYGYYVMNAVQGDLGQSLAFRSPVSKIIAQRVAPTVYVLVYGLALSTLLTLALAVPAARSQGGFVDQLVRLVCVTVVGIPSYWIGLMLIMFLGLQLKLFPVSGFGPDALANLWHMFMPALTIALAITPILTRNLRATLVAQMNADYATAGRSKGLPESYVFWRHVFPNSLLPTLNLAGVIVSFLIGGTVIVESVFNIPGLGQLMVRSVLTRDYFTVQGVTLVLALGVVLTTFIVDVLTVLLDPRVKL
jgi:peptide/nickel transport system permease protein